MINHDKGKEVKPTHPTTPKKPKPNKPVVKPMSKPKSEPTKKDDIETKDNIKNANDDGREQA